VSVAKAYGYAAVATGFPPIPTSPDSNFMGLVATRRGKNDLGGGFKENRSMNGDFSFWPARLFLLAGSGPAGGQERAFFAEKRRAWSTSAPLPRHQGRPRLEVHGRSTRPFRRPSVSPQAYEDYPPIDEAKPSPNPMSWPDDPEPQSAPDRQGSEVGTGSGYQAASSPVWRARLQHRR